MLAGRGVDGEGASYLQGHTVAPRHAGQGVFSVLVAVVGRRGRGVRDVALGAGERAPGLARPGGLGGARGLLLLGFFVGALEVEEVVDLGGWEGVSVVWGLGGECEGEGEVDGGALGEGGGGGVCGVVRDWLSVASFRGGRCGSGHLADPEFLAIAPLFLRLLELVLAVGEAGFLLGRPGRGGGQMTR